MFIIDTWLKQHMYYTLICWLIIVLFVYNNYVWRMEKGITVVVKTKSSCNSNVMVNYQTLLQQWQPIGNNVSLAKNKSSSTSNEWTTTEIFLTWKRNSLMSKMVDWTWLIATNLSLVWHLQHTFWSFMPVIIYNPT